MHRRHILVGITTCFFAAGFLPVGYVKAESATSAEAHAAAAREHAALARQNAARLYERLSLGVAVLVAEFMSLLIFFDALSELLIACNLLTPPRNMHPTRSALKVSLLQAVQKFPVSGCASQLLKGKVGVPLVKVEHFKIATDLAGNDTEPFSFRGKPGHYLLATWKAFLVGFPGVESGTLLPVLCDRKNRNASVKTREGSV